MVAEGYSVISLVRNNVQRDQGAGTDTSIVRTQLDQGDKVRNAIKAADMVIYCAGSVKGLTDSDFDKANVIGVDNIATVAIQEMMVPRIILISSLAASRPELSAYSKSKYLGESVVRSKSSLNWVVLRPTAVYGPRDRELLPLLLAIRSGIGIRLGPVGQQLSFLHVEDFARAIIAVCENFQDCSQNILEIHDGKKDGYTWDEIRDELRGDSVSLPLAVPRFILEVAAKANVFGSNLFRYSPMLTSGKVNEIWHSSWLCDNGKLTDYTGWIPKKKLREGVNASIKRR